MKKLVEWQKSDPTKIFGERLKRRSMDIKTKIVQIWNTNNPAEQY
jgi:hypothetical protein